MDFDLKKVLNDIKDKKKVSISGLQRDYSIGFIIANEWFGNLYETGYISYDGTVQTEKVYEALGLTYDPGIKIIFLDVDGVLNCSSTKDLCGCYKGIEDEKVSHLRKIIEVTDAKIVLVSSWKYHWYKDPNLKDKQDESAKYLDAKLNSQGLFVMDKTEDESVYRGEGILEYLRCLKSKGVKVDKFVILDDEVFDYKETRLMKHLVQTSFSGGGLQEKHIFKAWEKLGVK